MDSRRSSKRTTLGLREIDLATVRAEYVRQHKAAAVAGEHIAEVSVVDAQPQRV